MRIVLQRVSSASVTIGERVAGKIGRGLLVFVGIEAADTAADGEWLAQKIVRLRIFADEADQMNRSLADIAGAILVISQFTLHASTQKGARPSFNQAAPPAHARPLYEQFIAQLRTALCGSAAADGGERVATGEFGAMMQVALVNDGPVTLIIDSRQRD
jgi:D-aminoacyl-tRNA deacylase